MENQMATGTLAAWRLVRDVMASGWHMRIPAAWDCELQVPVSADLDRHLTANAPGCLGARLLLFLLPLALLLLSSPSSSFSSPPSPSCPSPFPSSLLRSPSCTSPPLPPPFPSSPFLLFFLSPSSSPYSLLPSPLLLPLLSLSLLPSPSCTSLSSPFSLHLPPPFPSSTLYFLALQRVSTL